MKTNYSINRKTALFIIWIVLCCLLVLQRVTAQVCSNPGNIIYGLTANGEIHPITVTNATVGAAITPSYGNGNNAPDQSNALGYNAVNGMFYFFKRNPSVNNQQFVSFNPATGTVSNQASCPTTNALYTGCVSFSGAGYYAMDAAARLYYYNIALNTWTLITSTFYNQSGTNITATLSSLSGGDIAIDGLGNLWILCASNSNYGLYKVSASLPITPVASITATQIITPTTVTPTGNSFAGIAFNATGQIFLTTYLDSKLYRLENNLTLTSLGTLSVNYTGIDLTSCNFPMTVLDAAQQSFTASLANSRQIVLTWTDAAQNNNTAYYIEHSVDQGHWEKIGFVQPDANGVTEKYAFTHTNQVNGNHYYRIKQVAMNGEITYSIIRTVTIKTSGEVAVWPNPAKDIVYISSNSSCTTSLFDQYGRPVYTGAMQPGVHVVNVQSLPAGTYIVRMQSSNGQAQTRQFIKQ
jgi:type IX secretion system substrate protein